MLISFKKFQYSRGSVAKCVNSIKTPAKVDTLSEKVNSLRQQLHVLRLTRSFVTKLIIELFPSERKNTSRKCFHFELSIYSCTIQTNKKYQHENVSYAKKIETKLKRIESWRMKINKLYLKLFKLLRGIIQKKQGQKYI